MRRPSQPRADERNGNSEPTAPRLGCIREIIASNFASGTQKTSDSILAGQYVQRVTGWIFPEVITPGATPRPLDFTGIGPLANGFGPDAKGNIFHQLSPWPGKCRFGG